MRIKTAKKLPQKLHKVARQTIPISKIALAQLQYQMYNCNALIINASIFLGQKNGGV